MQAALDSRRHQFRGLASEPAEAGAVRFIEGPGRVLLGLEITVPAASPALEQMYRALRRMRIQVMQVKLARERDRVTYHLDVAEFDGSDVCRERWVSLQNVVVGCVLGAASSPSNSRPRPVLAPRVFRDMLQKASLSGLP